MNILLFIKQALISIKGNKLRSFLSMLGIIIGIMSFVIMLSIGEGFKMSIIKQIGADSNVITINRGGRSDGGGISPNHRPDENKPNSSAKDIFNLEIAKEISQKVPMIASTFVKYSPLSYENIYEGQGTYISIYPVQKGYLENKKAKIAYGSMFSNKNFASGDKVIILGYNTLSELNSRDNGYQVPQESPIGKKIFIGGNVFLIAGILEENNQSDGYELNYSAFIPDTAAKKVFNKTEIYNMFSVVTNEKYIETIKLYLKFFLFKKSGSFDQSSLNFNLGTNKETLEMVNQFTGKFTLMLGGIGLIALIVGGIGIMNIMLVTVTERTREIGIRKAIGATNLNILMQFLIESIIITLLGSLIAIGLSYSLVYAINTPTVQEFLTTKMQMNDFNPFISYNIILIATCVAAFMGITFGIMPAYKAARLKPIDALRFE